MSPVHLTMPPTPPPDSPAPRAHLSGDDPLAQLSRAAAAGDPSAFTELHNRFNTGLVRLFLKRTSGRQDVAEDLAQRAWTLAWDSITKGKYDPSRASLSTFVYAVGNNVWLQHLRRAGRSIEVQGSDDYITAGPDDGPKDSSSAEIIQAVRDAIGDGPDAAGLTAEEKSIVRWACTGLSDRDLARRVGLAPSTVNVKKRGAYEKIKRFLATRGFRDASAIGGAFDGESD